MYGALYITGIMKNMKYHLPNKKGFISNYYLFIFLLLITLITCFLTNYVVQLKTIHNLEISNAYFMDEYIVIDDIKTRLLDEELENDTYVIQDISYAVEVDESIIYVDIYGKYNESLVIYYDNLTNKLLDYDSMRQIDDIYE